MTTTVHPNSINAYHMPETQRKIKSQREIIFRAICRAGIGGTCIADVYYGLKDAGSNIDKGSVSRTFGELKDEWPCRVVVLEDKYKSRTTKIDAYYLRVKQTGMLF